MNNYADWLQGLSALQRITHKEAYPPPLDYESLAQLRQADKLASEMTHDQTYASPTAINGISADLARHRLDRNWPIPDVYGVPDEGATQRIGQSVGEGFDSLGGYVRENPAESALLATQAAPWPIGDIAGIAADTTHYANHPEDRGWLNYALTAASALPGIPAGLGVGALPAMGAMTAWHGSPHKWERPDLSKIGTGEGNAGYGHGFYSGGAKGTGESYVESLRHMGELADGAGNKLNPKGEIEELAGKYFDEAGLREIDSLIQQGDHADEWIKVKDKIAQWKSDGVHRASYLYELDIPDETIDKMLDWDKPLSEQPESVRKQLFASDISKWHNDEFTTGKEWYEWSAKNTSPQETSEYLDSLGIPGIRYLDNESRAAGEGTSNYVIFNEKDIKPISRNGKPLGLLDGPAESRSGLSKEAIAALRAEANATRFTDDYASYLGSHRPMELDGGAAPLHDLTKSYPDDIYGPNALQYYGSGYGPEKKVLDILHKVKGKPDELVTIYRGVPDGIEDINVGDWVTLSPEYAEEYGKVISMEVPAKDITAWGDSLAEYGYFPAGKKGLLDK